MQTTKNENNFFIPRSLAVNYFVVLLAAAVLYIVSCAPGPLWQDSGMYQYRIWHNDIEGKLGLALSHPLYHIIGIGLKYIPLGEFAYRVNLISAIAAAFAIANLFLLLRLWLGKNAPALLAAITLALSWTIWQSASIAEVYTLYLALLLTELIMLLQYVRTKRVGFLYLLALFNGLAIADHMWGIIPLACYVVFVAVLLVQKQIKLRNIAVCVCLWVIGAAPYEYLIIKNILQTGDFATVIASTFFGKKWSGVVLNTHLSARLAGENLIFMAYNFPTPNVIFFFAGLYSLKKASPGRSFRNILLALLILFFVFAFRYTVLDRYVFFMPFYCLVSILIGVGFNALVTKPNRRTLCRIVFIFALLPIPAYIIAPVIAEKTQLKLTTKRDIPYRNEYVWFLRPWQTGCYGPERFADEVFNTIECNSIIYADSTTVSPLLYLQEVKKRRSDTKIIPRLVNSEDSPEFNEQTITKLLADKTVYVVSPVKGYCPDFLLKRYSFIPAGIIWRVVEKQEK
ncbi:MAG: DUF2723 domain-containing protein [Phycisphaerae bacterium]|nr:DUF2723 domain-containing protein [Phycisphaerae bacterium]MDD5381434.1 DUF2723 domain-containing protein [Phycisphaerae bacterium]